MLLSRLAQTAFVSVAGGDVKIVDNDNLLWLPFFGWAISSGRDICSGSFPKGEEGMLINLLKGVRCRGVERGQTLR